VVVKKDQAVQTDIELGGDLPQVGCLGLPVDAVSRHMRALEDHRRVTLEHGQSIIDVVLAAHGEKDATSPESLQLALKCDEGVPGRVSTELDAVNSIFADHPTPQCVVQVEDDALAAQAAG